MKTRVGEFSAASNYTEQASVPITLQAQFYIFQDRALMLHCENKTGNYAR